MKDRNDGIGKKVYIPTVLKKSYGLKENKKCCYSCSNCRVLSGHKFRCIYNNNILNAFFDVICDKYIDTGLVQCELCNLYVRSIGNHVKVHKITYDRYKKEYGYNRGTVLVCNGTSSHRSKLAIKKCKNILLQNRCSYNGNKGNRYNIRVEGKLNRR